MFSTETKCGVLHITRGRSAHIWLIIVLGTLFAGFGIYGAWTSEDFAEWLIAVLLAIVFGGVTIDVFFSRERFAIDRSAGIVTHTRSIFGINTTHQEVQLQDGPEKVLIRSQPMPMSDSPMTFVSLYGRNGHELDVVRETSVERARATAVEIADFLSFELIDTVGD